MWIEDENNKANDPKFINKSNTEETDEFLMPQKLRQPNYFKMRNYNADPTIT